MHNAWIAQPEHSSPAIVPTVRAKARARAKAKARAKARARARAWARARAGARAMLVVMNTARWLWW